ncbi:MAG TPA: trehalose-phosphatase, partial [Terriglobales bacterium]|nr:trehalose-phosphatase [Terriglobales bacterium]
ASDFDGTLAPIVADPDAARPLAGVVELLNAMAEQPGLRVALVSGRSLSDLRVRCPVSRGWYVGGHGIETGRGMDDVTSASTAPPEQMRRQLREMAAELQRQMQQWPGTRLEIKPYSLAMHFRAAPEWAGAVRDAFSQLARHSDFRVMLGRQVVELLPADSLTKGHAVQRLRRRLRCDLAFYFGDDTTDEDVFRLEDPDIIGIKVVHPETSQPTAAHYGVASPQAVVIALREIARLRQT